MPSKVAAAGTILLAALAAAAQDAPPKPGVPPTKRRPDNGPVFAPPEETPPEKPKEPEAPPAPPRAELDVLIDALGAWPAAGARAAAEALAGKWAESRPRVLEALRLPSNEGRAAAGAAAACRLSGDAETIPPLLAALKETRNYRWTGDILEAVVSLDAVGAKERLLPLLAVPSAAVVDRVAKILQPMLGPADLPRLREQFGAKTSATRRAALGLASEVDFAAVREELLGALADRAPEVAAGAAVCLSSRGGAEVLPPLNAAARGDDPRRASYAVLALVFAGERGGLPLLEDATVATLLGSGGLRSSDPLQRATAGMALADVGYLRPDPTVDPLLESEIVPALLEVVASPKFFPDLPVVKPPALVRLRRLCAGTDSLQTAPEWAKWWEDHAGGFVARRALVAIPAAVRGDLRVRIEGGGCGPAGPCVYAAAAAEAPPGGGAGGRFVALSGAEADRVAALAEASGVLTLPESMGDPEEGTGLSIAVEAGRRGRRVRIAAGVPHPEGLRALLAALAEIREANRWQRYWDRRAAPTFAEFAEGARRAWAETPEGERSARLVRMAVASLRDLEDDGDRLEALQRALAEPALAAALRPADAEAVASLAAVAPSLTPVAEAALRVLAKAGRTEGLPILRARLEGAGDEGERSSVAVLLEESLRAGPPEPVFEGAEGRYGYPVRCVALRALGARGDRGDARVIAALQKGIAAPEAEARAAAYLALGRLRAEGAVGVLSNAVEQDPDIGVKGAALEGLGVHGGASVVPVLGRAASSTDPRLRAAALRGLAACREPEGLTWMLAALTSDPDPSVRVEADRAVRSLGGDRAREALRSLALDRRRDGATRSRAVEGLGLLGAAGSRADLRALLKDPDDGVADAAAFALAWIRDGESAARVLDALRAGRSPGRALQCAELLSLEVFRSARDRAEAVALYTGWYEVSKDRGPRGWLVDALGARGLADEGMKGFETGANPRGVVPLLLKAFADAPWSLRRAINLELQAMAGKGFGEIDPWTPESRVAEVGAAWAAWWDGERGARR